MQSRINKHTCTELLIELIQSALKEEGCQTKRYSDGDKYFVSGAYDAIMVKGADGNYYELVVNECYPQKVYSPIQMFEDIDK